MTPTLAPLIWAPALFTAPAAASQTGPATPDQEPGNLPPLLFAVAGDSPSCYHDVRVTVKVDRVTIETVKV